MSKAHVKVNTLKPVDFKDVRGRAVKLSFKDVKDIICGGQKHTPTDQEVYLFMHFCKAHEADPFAKDAQLIKYSEKHPAAFVLTFSHVNKVAASDPDFDGCESGIVIRKKVKVQEDGKEVEKEELEYREGTLLFEEDGEVLVGGWARAYSKQQDHEPLVTVKLKTYDKGGEGEGNRWSKDKPGMIRKVAIVQAKKEVCPRKLSGALIAEEVSSDGLGGPRVIDLEPEGNLEADMFEDLKRILMENKNDFIEDSLRTYMESLADTMKLSLTECCQRFVDNITDENELEKFWGHYRRWLKKNELPDPEDDPGQESETQTEGSQEDGEKTSEDTAGDPTDEEGDKDPEIDGDVYELRKKLGDDYSTYRCFLHVHGYDEKKERELAVNLQADQEAFDQFTLDMTRWWDSLKKKDREKAMKEVNEGRLFL